MKLSRAIIKNFRRFDEAILQFENKETIFVGPNNSGKTSATSAFRCFLGKRDFKIFDFPLSKLSQLDAYDPEKYNPENSSTHVPSISLDLWFSIDIATAEYGRAVSLVSKINEGIAEVGLSCTFNVNSQTILWSEYTKMYPADNNGNRKQTLSAFLGIEGHLKKYFSIDYAALKNDLGKLTRSSIPPTEGKRTLRSLLRVDFVDAQRHVQDDDETGRGNKLSAAFAAFYRANLKHAEAGEEAVRIVEENNTRLTKHYSESFSELMEILKKLGVPSAHERTLEIVSILGADEALKGTTDLFYKEPGNDQSLPEAYNGLGFKNLVLMAIQLRDFQVQWANTDEDRPLCHLIFIEEPEVHLHAQVQQTFIANMWSILNELAEKEGIGPQLVVTTHSSHILNSVDFENVRYFRRCRRVGEDPMAQSILSISEVLNLRDFQMSAVETEDEHLTSDQALNFLKRYLTLTHCDLMFADAAILIEGAAERILLPAMIKKVAPGLGRTYLTILEVGGAYAHVFAELMAFLYIPYLVITDIDSVKSPEAGGRKKACCAADANAVTSNGAIKAFFAGITNIADLSVVSFEQQTQEDGNRFVTFQKPVTVALGETEIALHGRTLEEAFIYENMDSCGVGGFLDNILLPEEIGAINQDVFKLVKSSTFKKTAFALRVLSADGWNTPSYIRQGLSWLATRLDVQVEEVAK
tara:strand:- start:3386 stop:5473 length:2088 start_codon:yes stop_codon:yes gene_type:complete